MRTHTVACAPPHPPPPPHTYIHTYARERANTHAHTYAYIFCTCIYRNIINKVIPQARQTFVVVVFLPNFINFVYFYL